MARRGTSSRGLARRDPFFEFWDQPFGLLRAFTDDLDRLFGAPFGGRRSAMSPFGGWQPSVDLVRRDDKLVVRADLPGMSKDDVDVQISDEAITISGERQEEREETQHDVYVRERRYGAFSRVIPLPDDVDAQQAKATFQNGMLEIELPLTERARARQPRRIEISEGARGQTAQAEKAKAAGAGASA